MGVYQDIDTDFAQRTLKIIEQYDRAKQPGPENFEVTLLVLLRWIINPTA